MPNKLNLGSGKDIKKGYDNMDILPFKGVNIVRDMKRGIPRNDNYYTEILSRYSLTQIKDSEDFKFIMNELHRVLKKTGILKIKVPNARHPDTDSFNDPMDCRLFTEETFDYFDKNHYRWKSFNYGFKPWTIICINPLDEIPEGHIRLEESRRLYIEMKPYKK